MSGKYPQLFDKCVLWAPLTHSNVTNSAKVVTANGNTTQVTTISDPWGLARPIGYFDGNGDYLTIPLDSDITLVGSSAYTLEFRFRLNATGVSHSLIGTRDGDTSSTMNYSLHVNSSNVLAFESYNTAVGIWTSSYLYGSTALSVDTWYTVALTYNGTTIKVYLNGNLEMSGNTTGTLLAGTLLRIGKFSASTLGYTNGYMSELRISNTVRYTTNYTPSVTRFAPDVYTKLLLHMYGTGNNFTDDPYIDYDEFPIIPSGVTPTNNGTWTKTSLGNNKSILNFDGSTNYITLPASSSFDFGTGSFTILTWVKFTAINQHYGIFDFNVDNNNRWLFTYQGATGTNLYLLNVASSSTNLNVYADISPSISTWLHICITRSGNNFVIYKDATALTTTGTPDADSVYYSASGYYHIGCYIYNSAVAAQLNGNIKDLMIFKDRALSVSEIKLIMNKTHPTTGTGIIPGPYDYWRNY